MPESLEKLDLLLIHKLRSRRVRPDGIGFHSFRCLPLTLAAYVGEDVIICYDARDMGEIRVFYRDKLLCRAIRLTWLVRPSSSEISFALATSDAMCAICEEQAAERIHAPSTKTERRSRGTQCTHICIRRAGTSSAQALLQRVASYLSSFRRWSIEGSLSFARRAGATAISVSATGRPVWARLSSASTSAEARASCPSIAGAFAPWTDKR